MIRDRAGRLLKPLYGFIGGHFLNAIEDLFRWTRHLDGGLDGRRRCDIGDLCRLDGHRLAAVVFHDLVILLCGDFQRTCIIYHGRIQIKRFKLR